MFKRTHGNILLVLLVVTGLASQVSNNTLSSKDRRLLVHHLKESRNGLLQCTKGLSAAQLDFRPAPGQWTIRECIEHATLAESYLWDKASDALIQRTYTVPNQPHKTDHDILAAVRNQSEPITIPGPNHEVKGSEASVNTVLHTFKDSRAQTIKFVRTTTDDIRNRTARSPFGEADLYQALLAMSAYTNNYTKEINEIKAHPRFPQ